MRVRTPSGYTGLPQLESIIDQDKISMNFPTVVAEQPELISKQSFIVFIIIIRKTVRQNIARE